MRREARRLIDILGDCGHYVLSTVHFLIDDVPFQNALALYEEAMSYRTTAVL